MIVEAVYNRLFFKFPIQDSCDVRVIVGNNEAFDIKGFVVLPVYFGLTFVWHEFRVVLNFTLEVLIRAYVFALYLSSLLYFTNDRNRL